MKTLERAIWCLSGVVLMSAASWAQDRGVGREAASRRKLGSRDAMEDRVRSIRLNQYSSTRFLLQLQSYLQQTSPESFEGDNYINLIPLVINEDGVRTNVGLNNFSRFSVHKGANPAANVAIGLYDSSGNLDRAGVYYVQSNQMLQINDIFDHRDMESIPGGGTASTGWLLILSDEPVTAWASVILDRVNNDPAMELAIADQMYKSPTLVESQGTPDNPLLIQSSVRAGFFKSRLAVVNVGNGAGRLRINLFDQNGVLQEVLSSVDVQPSGMYVNNDIRSTVQGTYGQITIEVEDLNPAWDDREPRIIATSLVESTTGPFAGFFPAFSLPQSDTPAIAGVWEGLVSGTIMNAQVRVILFQERDMLYGTLDILSGSFPTIDRGFLIRGEVVSGSFFLEIQDRFDACFEEDDPCTFIGYRLFAPSISGDNMNGDTIYFDEADRFDKGSFTLTRVSAVYPTE